MFGKRSTILWSAILLRLLPLLWGTECWDLPVYRLHALPVLEGMNPYLYTSGFFVNVPQPFVYFPFSMFFAPAALAVSWMLQLPFQVLIKLPLIAMDAAIIITLCGIASGRRGRAAAWAYALSPVSILTTSFHGNIITASVLFTLLAYAAWNGKSGDEAVNDSRRATLCALLLGVAVAWRTYPLLFLPIFLIRFKSIKRASLFLFWALIPPLLSAVPFLLSNPASLLSVLGYTGATSTLGWPPILDHLLEFAGVADRAPYTALVQSHLPMLFYASLAFILILISRNRGNVLNPILGVLLLAYFFISSISPQYLVWALPFLCLWSVRRAWLYGILGGAAMTIQYWSAYPEILFGRLLPDALPMPSAYLCAVILTAFWSTAGYWAFSLFLHKPSLADSVFADSIGEQQPASKRLSISYAIVLTAGLIISVFLFEVFFVLKMPAHQNWRATNTVPFIVRNREASFQNLMAGPQPGGYFWCRREDSYITLLDSDGIETKRITLKNPVTGDRLPIYDAVSAKDGMLFITSYAADAVFSLNPSTGVLEPVFSVENPLIPSCLDINSTGYLAVLDIGRESILLLGPGGDRRSFPYPIKSDSINVIRYDIGLDDQNNIYLLDGLRRHVRVIDPQTGNHRDYPVNVFLKKIRIFVEPEGHFWTLNWGMAHANLYSKKGTRIGRLQNDPRSDKKTISDINTIFRDRSGSLCILDGSVQFEDKHPQILKIIFYEKLLVQLFAD